MSEAQDDHLLAEWRALVSGLDPAPAEVTEFAKGALGWRRVDAELAEILADSQLTGAAAGTRTGGHGPRTVSLEAQTVRLDLQIDAEDGSMRILGQITPAAAASVEAQRDDLTSGGNTETDAHGRFRLVLPGGGRIRLRIERAGFPPVETAWLPI
jgi:hypothetical protein